MEDHNLTGTYRVRAGRWALQEAKKWLPKMRDRMELRRHALKLRFWPDGVPDNPPVGQLLDLDWCWIKALPGKHIGELRIHDVIGGCDNLRIIFFVPTGARSIIATPLPMIWVLSMMQKKRDDFTPPQIKNFKLRRTIVLERFYTIP